MTGPGIEEFSTAERMGVCNMSTEIGGMITLFGTKEREEDVWENYEIELSAMEPQIAKPFSPVNVVPVREVAGNHYGYCGFCKNRRRD